MVTGVLSNGCHSSTLPLFNHRRIDGTDSCYYLVISRNDGARFRELLMHVHYVGLFSIVLNVFYAYSVTALF